MKKILLLVLALTVSTFCALATGRRVLFIGDSITDGGWGANNGAPSNRRNHTDMNHIFGHGYMSLCASHYMSRRPQQDYAFFNRGISGNSLEHLEARWQEDVLDLRPDVLSVLIGTNDVEYFLRQRRADASLAFDFAAWESRFRRLLEAARSQNPQLRLVLCAPFVAQEGPTGSAADYPLRQQMVGQLSGIVRQLARDYGAVFLPYDRMFARLVKKQPRPGYWIWDGVHPTPAGHQRMADMWIKRVKL